MQVTSHEAFGIVKYLIFTARLLNIMDMEKKKT